jgi:hypothetical protein
MTVRPHQLRCCKISRLGTDVYRKACVPEQRWDSVLPWSMRVLKVFDNNMLLIETLTYFRKVHARLASWSRGLFDSSMPHIFSRPVADQPQGDDEAEYNKVKHEKGT